jgi:PAS domain-containing protein
MSGIPIVMLTARAGEESRVEALEAGADDYLVKPFSGRELLARIGAHIQIARLRRQTSEAVRESEERFRALVSASSDVMYRMSADGSEMRYLRGREFISDTHEPSQTWLQKYIHPEDQAHVLTVIREAVRTRSVFELEHRVVRADGSLGWTFSRAIPMLDDHGEIVEWFGMASDVTARKEAEVKLRRGEERMRLLWEAAAALLTTDDPDMMLRQLFDKIGPHLKLDTYLNFMVNDRGNGLKLASCIGISVDAARTFENLAFGQAICGSVAVLRKPLTAKSPMTRRRSW